jgi:hypothetical protein
MALTWSSALRDLVSREVFNRAYADLRTEEAAYLDASNSPAVPTTSPAGVAGHSLLYVRQFAQWFEEAGASSGPDAWEHVLAAEVSFRLANAFNTAKARTLAGLLQRAWDAALNSYSLADASSTTLNDLTITPKVCRLHVMRNFVRRRPRLFYPIPSIDMTMKRIWQQVWNQNGYEFRTRQASIAIATTAGGSAPTITMNGSEAFDSILAPRLWYTDSDTASPRSIEWVDGDWMARLKAENTGTTGRPQYYSIEDRGGTTKYWHFSPEPDAAYTVRAECLVRTPTDPANASATTFQDTLTAEIVPRLPKLTLLGCLEEAPGVPVTERQAAKAELGRELELLLPRFTRVNATAPLAAQDVYGDMARPSSSYTGWSQGL